MIASVYWARDLNGETRVVTEDDHHHAMLNAALTAEREWLEGTAKARADAIAACIVAIEAIPHTLECVSRDEHYNRPCNCPISDTLAALRKVQP